MEAINTSFLPNCHNLIYPFGGYCERRDYIARNNCLYYNVMDDIAVYETIKNRLKKGLEEYRKLQEKYQKV